ncbi:MAG: D-alanyl-D-alanine carboxypeptidase [Turicibacter sp.]|nr:D-alanyl-D-alanine carboxypeptidase [Turicibacter sp.]
MDFVESTILHQAASVTVMDVNTGFVIYEYAQHELRYPASITKIMTALIVIEEVEDLEEQMIFSEESILMLPYYASRLWALPGDELTVYEALYALMLPSGNDAANALAEHIAGSVDDFVVMMNQRANEIGALNTQFINPSGLPGEPQNTTSYDMALIMREALTHPVFTRIISTAEYALPPMQNFSEGRNIWNTNQLIRQGQHFNPLVVGGKTGFTNAAQHTLVSYAVYGEHEVIISVLFAPQHATFSDTTAILDYILEIPVQTVFDPTEQSWEIPVMQAFGYEFSEEGGVEIGIVTAQTNQHIRLPLPQDAAPIREVLNLPVFLSPPVRVGDILGSISIYSGDNLIDSLPIISTNSVLPQIATMPIMPTATVNTVTDVEQMGGNSLNILIYAVSAVFVALLVVILLINRQMKIEQKRRRRAARIRRNNRYSRFN